MDLLSRQMEKETQAYGSKQNKVDTSISKDNQPPQIIMDAWPPSRSDPNPANIDFPKQSNSGQQELTCSKEDLILFDRFIRCRQHAKPKDTLASFRRSHHQFLAYQNQLPKPTISSSQLSSSISTSNTSTKKFYEYTVTKKIPLGTFLFIRVMSAQPSKCHIIVSDEDGSPVNFYPSAVLKKKKEKIVTIALQYNQNPIIVLDYCFCQVNTLYFHSIYRKERQMSYFALNVKKQQYEDFIKKQLEDLSSTLQLSFVYGKYGVQVVDMKMKEKVLIENVGEKIRDQLFTKFEMEIEFLQQLRGKRQGHQRRLEFDLMAVAFWRKHKLGVKEVANKIIKLYKMKEERIQQQLEVPVPEQDDLHTPHKMKKQRNCVLCLSRPPNYKHNRTFFVCQLCSAQKQRPVYLCIKCFAEYHQNTQIPLFNKHEKNTREKIKEARKNAIKSQDMHVQLEKQEQVVPSCPGQAQISKKRAILARLDQLTDEVFSRIDQVMLSQEPGSLDQCELYLSTFLNKSIQFMAMKESRKKELNEIKQEYSSQK